MGSRVVLGGVALAALAAAALRPATELELENTSRGRTVRFPAGVGQVFSVTFQHSMYDRPFAEEYVVRGDGRIALQAVSSPSAAVREYLGILGAGERHAVERVMSEIVFRVAAGAPQTLRVGGVEHSFLEFGDHGDRLVLRAVRRPAAARFLESLLGAAP